MKASELIKDLERMVNEHGDFIVVVYEGFGPNEVDAVTFHPAMVAINTWEARPQPAFEIE